MLNFKMMTMSQKFKLPKHSLVVLLLTTLFTFSLAAQDVTSEIELKGMKCTDDSRKFDLKLSGESEEGAKPVYEAKIELYSILDGQSALLGTVTTDREGKASLKLDKETRYLKNKEGVAEVKAIFKGQGKMSSSEASLKFKELNLQVTLSEKDSSNTMLLQATAIGPNGELLPLKETNFNLYVQGLFSKLKIGECFVDAGEGTFEFPRNIPGDVNGNLQIFARLEENEEFGEVEKIENAKWGIHRSGFVEPSRSLWSSGAPIWMITTLIILLAGVWSHYIYAIVQMVKIKKEGDEIE
jgi:5-hydroxyisourate hydrolase-like protein (transthyretin family)